MKEIISVNILEKYCLNLSRRKSFPSVLGKIQETVEYGVLIEFSVKVECLFENVDKNRVHCSKNKITSFQKQYLGEK